MGRGEDPGNPHPVAHVRGAEAPSSETGQLPGNLEAAGQEADRALPAPSGSQSWGGQGALAPQGAFGTVWRER